MPLKNSKKKCIMPVNLRFFGEEQTEQSNNSADSAKAAEAGNAAEASKPDTAAETFTQSQVEKMISDKLAEEQSKLQKDYDARLEKSVKEARTEADKLAKMNAEQKAQYEREKQDSALKAKEDELNARAAEMSRREMDMQVKDILTVKGFPPSLSVLIQAASDAEANEKVKVLEEYLKTAVTDMTNDALRGKGIVAMPGAKDEDPFLNGFNSK